MRTSIRQRILFPLMLPLIGVVLPLALAEIILRFLPVIDLPLVEAVDEARPVFRFAPDRAGVWSLGPNMAFANGFSTNNAGYVSGVDYDADATTPLVAVIGDSYVEAVQVPYDETLQGRLAAHVGEEARVYSFGASGAPLSQYLSFARHASKTYRPDFMVFLIIGNDFDESYQAYHDKKAFHVFRETESGDLELVVNSYQPDPVRRHFRRFSLARYLTFNVRAWDIVRAWLGDGVRRGGEAEKYAGNVVAHQPAHVVARSRRVADEFLERLEAASGLPSDRILFLVDGFRVPPVDDLQRQQRADTYFGLLRSHFIKSAREKNYHVVDMDDVFFPAYVREQKRFDFPSDGHWNGYAHGLAADAVSTAPGFRKNFLNNKTNK